MRKVHCDGKYDFYFQAACGDDQALYNIVTAGSPTPEGGYFNMKWIEKVKGVRFPCRYQPELHGTTHLYTSSKEPTR